MQLHGSFRISTAPVELLEELCGYLPERYPSLYQRTPVGMDNLVTGESFNIVERPLIEDPMQMAARLVRRMTLAIMFEKEDGQYYLLAGCYLTGWVLEIGRQAGHAAERDPLLRVMCLVSRRSWRRA
jgi:hypothetical protein